MATLCLVDDKHVPLYRILWISALPHFCGEPDCRREGQYEIRLECGEAVWASQQDRDTVFDALKAWHGDPDDFNESDDAGESGRHPFEE